MSGPNGGVAPHDELLVAAATELLDRRFRQGRHQIAAAVRGTSGAIYVGLHVEATIGRASVCAESVALGNAMIAGEDGVVAVVAIRGRLADEAGSPARLVPPCGLCREVLSDYGRLAVVLLDDAGTVRTVHLDALLPEKYVGSKFRNEEPRRSE